MLRLITGRTGCGKTTRLYEIIKEKIEQGEEVTLIVPEQYSFHTEKKMLELLGAKGADSVEVVSFSFLAKNLLKKYGLNSDKALDDSTRAIIMSVALDEIGDRLQVFGRHRYSPAVIKHILKLIREFRQCAITPELIREKLPTMEDSLLKNKMQEILLVTETYTALVEQSFFDDECALDILCRALDEKKDFLKKTVFIDGFRGFTAQEYKVLERIFVQADDVYVTLCVDSGNADGDFSAFAHTRRTKRRLITTAQKNSVGVAVPEYLEKADGGNAELAALEKGIYSGEYEIYDEPTENITLCSAEDIESECEYVAHTVKRLIRTEGLRCRDIAIISRSESGYSRRIRSALAQNGVPVFEDKRQPITSEPLTVFVAAALEIASDGFSTDVLMRLLKTGLTDLGIEEISRVENYALLWQINGRRWLDEWTAHPNGLGEQLLEKDVRELEQLNEIRVRIVSPLQKFRVKMKNATALEASQAVYYLLVDMNVAENLKRLAVRLNERVQSELAAEQDRVWNIIIDILDRMAESLDGVRLDASRFSDIFSLVVSTYSVGNLPQGLDEIVIGSADRVRTNSPKVVFAVGMNDGVFPMIPSSDGLLSEKERRTLAELDLKTDDSLEEKMMEEHFLAYSTLCSPSERLFVTYSRRDGSGAQAACSEIVTQIKNIFPKITFVDTVCEDEKDKIESRDSAFALMARLTQKGGTLHATLEKYFETQPSYADRLAALRRGVNRQEMKIENEATATELFGRDMYMSASRTEVYHKCPFEYFCKYGLNAQPRKTAELDPMQKGTAIHYILEKLISIYGSDALCAMEKSERDKCVYDILEEYFKEILADGADLGERFLYLYRSLGTTVCEVADRLVAEFSVSDFKPVAFELKIDRDGEVGTYDIPLADGGTLRLKGSVDRVDIAEQEGTAYVRVVDYKSGGKKFDLNEVFYGLNMQMLIYLFAIWKNGFRGYKNITPAGVLYMPVNAPFVSVERDEKQDMIESMKMKSAKMNGMILDDSRVIYMMDSSGKGVIVPASIKKDGGNSGTLISLKQMNLLMKRVERILADMAESLHRGVIRISPAAATGSGSPYKDVCKYCDYKEVCLADEDTPTREISSMKHEESLAELGGESDA